MTSLDGEESMLDVALDNVMAVTMSVLQETGGGRGGEGGGGMEASASLGHTVNDTASASMAAMLDSRSSRNMTGSVGGLGGRDLSAVKVTDMSCFHGDINTLRVVVEVFLTMPIATFGIVGNALAFAVLWRQRKARLTTTFLLKCLAIVDTLILVLMVLLQSLRYTDFCLVRMGNFRQFYGHMFVALYPVVYLLRLAEMWLTVMLTIDRYIAVCKPLHAQSLCVISKAYRNVVIMAAAALVFTSPRFFEHKLFDNEHGFIAADWVKEGTVYTILYRIILFFIFMYLAPIVLLTTFNVGLLVALRKAKAARQQLMANGHDAQGQGQGYGKSGSSSPADVVDAWRTLRRATSLTSSASRSVTAIVVIVCVVCLVTNLCTLLSHLLWSLHMTFTSTMSHVEEARRYVSHVSNLCVTVNSSVNFVIYYVCSRNFRAEFARTVSCSSSKYRQRQQDANCRKFSSTSFTAVTTMPRRYYPLPATSSGGGGYVMTSLRTASSVTSSQSRQRSRSCANTSLLLDSKL